MLDQSQRIWVHNLREMIPTYISYHRRDDANESVLSYGLPDSIFVYGLWRNDGKRCSYEMSRGGSVHRIRPSKSTLPSAFSLC
jgi:hypothetical protein